MPASVDSRALQLQISASSELLIRNLKTADQAIGEFRRDTERNLTRIDSGFDRLGKPLEKIRASYGRLGGGSLTAGLIGAIGGATLVQAGKQALDYASSLGEVSQQLGVTTADLQIYRYAASQVGIEQETMDKGLAKLTQTMGKAELGADGPRKAFAAIGLSIADLKGKTAGDVIPRIADALARIPDPARRAAIEVALFGKAGQQLDTLLAGGRAQIDGLGRAARDLGLILSDEQIQKADRTADKLSELKQVLAANIAGVVADNANSIYQLSTGLATLTGEIVRFLGSNPDRALSFIGLLAGSRLGASMGGVPGAVVGGTIGMIGGDILGGRAKREMDDAIWTSRFDCSDIGQRDPNAATH